MAEEIEICWSLLQSMQSLRVEDWDTEAAMMTWVVDTLAHTRLLQPIPDSNRQLSFISKYLFWRVNSAFPIWDINARTALDNNNEPSWESYKAWGDQVRQEAAKHKVCCLDQIRLPGESLIRTLDKALYTIGGRIGATRALSNAAEKLEEAVGAYVALHSQEGIAPTPRYVAYEEKKLSKGLRAIEGTYDLPAALARVSEEQLGVLKITLDKLKSDHQLDNMKIAAQQVRDACQKICEAAKSYDS